MGSTLVIYVLLYRSIDTSSNDSDCYILAIRFVFHNHPSAFVSTGSAKVAKQFVSHLLMMKGAPKAQSDNWTLDFGQKAAKRGRRLVELTVSAWLGWPASPFLTVELYFRSPLSYYSRR